VVSSEHSRLSFVRTGTGQPTHGNSSRARNASLLPRPGTRVPIFRRTLRRAVGRRRARQAGMTHADVVGCQIRQLCPAQCRPPSPASPTPRPSQGPSISVLISRTPRAPPHIGAAKPARRRSACERIETSGHGLFSPLAGYLDELSAGKGCASLDPSVVIPRRSLVLTPGLEALPELRATRRPARSFPPLDAWIRCDDYRGLRLVLSCVSGGGLRAGSALAAVPTAPLLPLPHKVRVLVPCGSDGLHIPPLVFGARSAQEPMSCWHIGARCGDSLRSASTELRWQVVEIHRRYQVKGGPSSDKRPNASDDEGSLINGSQQPKKTTP